MKRCIFYLPYELDKKAARARMVRPRKMIQAFQDNGYEVFVITGYAKERKKRIRELKKEISAGVGYQFMYSEASTMPTLLTEPHHFPSHPFLDFGFFKYVKKQGINIGLFYPDIYWKFENYGVGLAEWKKFFALKNYELDIRAYEDNLTRFYVPSKEICRFVQSEKLSTIAEELPPGADDLVIEQKSYANRNFAEEPLTVFYVGGLGNQYQITDLITAVNQTPNTKLVLCCREDEWSREKASLADKLSNQVEIIHKSGSELELYYKSADICSLLFQKDKYIEMAKPVKAYEYLAHELPVLATRGTGIGKFVEENDIGWTIEYNEEAIQKKLKEIISNPAILLEKQKCCIAAKKINTWTSRAEQVEKGLLNHDT